jgi:hypothetical protein
MSRKCTAKAGEPSARVGEHQHRSARLLPSHTISRRDPVVGNRLCSGWLGAHDTTISGLIILRGHVVAAKQPLRPARSERLCRTQAAVASLRCSFFCHWYDADPGRLRLSNFDLTNWPPDARSVVMGGLLKRLQTARVPSTLDTYGGEHLRKWRSASPRSAKPIHRGDMDAPVAFPLISNLARDAEFIHRPPLSHETPDTRHETVRHLRRCA